MPAVWLSESLEGLRFGVESGDGFDEAGDCEGVADAAGFADEMELAVFAAEREGHANERRNSGAVDGRHTVQHDDDFARTVLQGRFAAP